MAAELKPYPDYKDSGVEWLGAVPAHWKQLPGRACYREKQVPNTGLTETTVLFTQLRANRSEACREAAWVGSGVI